MRNENSRSRVSLPCSKDCFLAHLWKFHFLQLVKGRCLVPARVFSSWSPRKGRGSPGPLSRTTEALRVAAPKHRVCAGECRGCLPTAPIPWAADATHVHLYPRVTCAWASQLAPSRVPVPAAGSVYPGLPAPAPGGGGGRSRLHPRSRSHGPAFSPAPAPLPPSFPPAAAAAPRHKKRLGLGRAGTMTETTKTHVILLSCGTFNPITKGHIQMFGESRRDSGRGSGRGWGFPRGSRGAPTEASGAARLTGPPPAPPGRVLSALGGAEGAAGGGGGTAGPGRLRGRSGRALSAAGGSGRAAAHRGGGLRAGPVERCPRRMRWWRVAGNQPGGHRGKRPHDGEMRRGD